MTAFALVILAVAVIAPLIWSLRGSQRLRGRREAALSLHRLQLAELDRDLAAERISASDHATARLEIQRRILAADAEGADAKRDDAGRDDAGRDDAGRGDPALANAGPPRSRWSSVTLIASVFVVPAAAFALYMIHGHPELPAAPLAARVAEADKQAVEETRLIDQLRQNLATLDPKSDRARQGYVLLGNAEANRNHFHEAAEAWRTALAARFDATLAAQTAEMQSRMDGRVTDDTAALFRKALAAAPPDAPWRDFVEKRLADGK